jgi:hypothetical protein
MVSTSSSKVSPASQLIVLHCDLTIHTVWANNTGFPNAGDGFDAIVRSCVLLVISPLTTEQIGQDINGPRTTTGMDPLNVASSLALPQQEFVVPRGGEYFLVPSISALKTKFAA